jgi:uncharacterized membrane protein
MKAMNLGKRIAPPRFLMFATLFVVGLAVAIPLLDLATGTMVAFDVAAVAFFVAIFPVLRRGSPDQMRASSQANDANRAGLLIITVVTSVVVLVCVISERGTKDAWSIALVLGSLVLAWVFSNLVYALHYAHMFYVKSDEGDDSGGIKFPDCDDPDYWDFIYFSFTLGMTFQTSDVDITSRTVRRVVTGHCLAAFVFNLGVLALTINTIGGKLSGG